MSSSLEGRTAVVFGVANKRSIAWSIAQGLHNAGAKLAITYQNPRLEEEAKDLIDAKAGAQTVERHAWSYLKSNLKNLPVRLRLDLIFHANPAVRSELLKDYIVRNEAAHNYKSLPNEAKDISAWLHNLEELVSKF